MAAWATGGFEQVLRTNPGETKVRSRCELTLPLSAPKPLTFIASAATSTESVGWKGTAAVGKALAVSGCSAYPCEVTAVWRASGATGTPIGCTVTADDGTSSLAGDSTGTALTVAAPPTAPVIFNQALKLGAPGTPIAGRCTLRQSAVLPSAEVTALTVDVNGGEVLNVPGPTLIGNVAWPTKWSPVAFGTVYVGSSAGPVATRLKHVTPKKEQMSEGDALRCAGEYASSSGTKVFDVNVSSAPVGNGMSLATGPTGWTCSTAKFGSGDGCDCDCGILDPDCSAGACDQVTVRAATFDVQTVGAPATAEYLATLAILVRIDADVVGVHEIASSADDSNFLSLAADAGYPYTLLPPSNPFGAQHSGFMSRYPLLSSQIHTAPTLSGDPSANDITHLILEALVDVPGTSVDLTVVVNHWKSGTGDTNEFRRSVESIRTAQALAGLDTATDAFMVMGNVNEEIDMVPRTPNPFRSEPAGLPVSFSLGADIAAELAGPGVVNDPFSYLTASPPGTSALSALQLDGSDATVPAGGWRYDYLLVSDRIVAVAEVYDSQDEGIGGGLPKAGSALPATTSSTASSHFPVFGDLQLPVVP